jgi:S1-C subfamily serine protease
MKSRGRGMRSGLLGLALGCAVAGVGGWRAAADAQEAAPFTLEGETLEGTPFDIASMTGRVVLVCFWSSQDPASVQTLPILRRFQRDFRAAGFAVVGVSGDSDRQVLENFLREYPLPWPTLHAPVVEGSTSEFVRHGVQAVPAFFLVGRDGKVLSVNAAPRDLRRQLVRLCGPARPGPIVVRGAEASTSVNDMLDRILDTGERWVGEGKTASGGQLTATRPPPTARVKTVRPNRRQLGGEEIYRRAIESVYVVGTLYRTPGDPEWHAWVSTAFVVTADGVLATSAHVFDYAGWDVGATMAFNAAGEVFPVEQILAMDLTHDTCLFRIAAKGRRPLPLGEAAPAGALVWAMSHPGSSVYQFTAGHVGGYEDDDFGQRWMLISAEYGEGSSGGPVLDGCGNVVGQVSRTGTLFTQSQSGPAPGAAAPGNNGEPQMVFRYCTPVSALRRLCAP